MRLYKQVKREKKTLSKKEEEVSDKRRLLI